MDSDRTRLVFRLRRRTILAPLVAIALLGGAAIPAGAGTLDRRPAPKSKPAPKKQTAPKKQPKPLSVISVSPANGAGGVAPHGPVKVTFNEALSPQTPLPSIAPEGTGTWTRSAPNVLTFVPTLPFIPLANPDLTIPGGRKGMLAADGARLARAVKTDFTVQGGSVLRLQQLLSLLDYSPLSWAPTAAAIAPGNLRAQISALYAPPAGSFAWRLTGWPTELTDQWQVGSYSVMTRGLVMEFQADHYLTVDGNITAGLWLDLVRAMAAQDLNAGGYNFALANQASPESLEIWHDAKLVIRSPANTGTGRTPTADGVFAVFARYRNQVMKGKLPGGQKYADPVQYVAYFNGGDAVHYLARSDYGIPQSLGCVELPLAEAAEVWPYLAYGTLVDVIN